MLFTEINQGFFATPETAPYASLKDIHKDIKEEVELLETALDALNAAGNPLFNTPLELLEHGKKLHQRYKNIRHDKDMWFRDNLFYAHAYRISLTFARLNVAQTLALFNFNQMKSILDSPIPVQTFYFLSFAILSVRLLINLAKTTEHMLFPTDEEFADLPSMYDRAMYELSLDHMNIINDIIWATANLLTNYPQVFGLSNPAVNIILLSCLTFDLFSSAHMYNKNETAYTTKISEYKHALAHMTPGDINFEVLSMQRKQLELTYLGDKAKLNQFLAAGTVILLAFTLIASSALPFFLPLGAALCVFGTSLYLTAGKRGDYIKAPSAEKDTAYAAYTAALIKNTVYPLLFMIAAASFGWPIAMLLALSAAIYDNKETIENMLEPAEATHFHLA